MDTIQPTGVIGRPTPRIDGPAKVTGLALDEVMSGVPALRHA